MLAACPCAEWRAIFCLARLGGMRRVGIVGLRWEDVHWKENLIGLHGAKAREGHGARMRNVPLFPEIAAALRELMAGRTKATGRIVLGYETGSNQYGRADEVDHRGSRHQGFREAVPEPAVDPLHGTRGARHPDPGLLPLAGAQSQGGPGVPHAVPVEELRQGRRRDRDPGPGDAAVGIRARGRLIGRAWGRTIRGILRFAVPQPLWKPLHGYRQHRSPGAELPSALGKRPADTAREIQLMAALRMFECGRISGGMAAELTGVSRAEFIRLCGQHGVSIFQQTADELWADAKAIADAGRR